MNRDDIIRMAREAGIHVAENNSFADDMYISVLYRFAALVAAAKDAEHQQTLALQQRAYEREIEIEVEAEREACAKVCDGWLHADGDHCAAAIRARGNT